MAGCRVKKGEWSVGPANMEGGGGLGSSIDHSGHTVVKLVL
jgi:hypothetical protein